MCKCYEPSRTKDTSLGQQLLADARTNRWPLDLLDDSPHDRHAAQVAPQRCPILHDGKVPVV